MKKFLFIIAAAVVAFASCNKEDENAVKSVSLDQVAVTLNEGETVTLVATVLPESAANKSITWSSDNEAVATVSNGKVTAVKVGEAKITATTADGGKTAECAVTVKTITWTAVYTEDFSTNVIRTAFNAEGSWSVFSLGQDASMKGGLAFGWNDGVVTAWTDNPNSMYASSYWGPAYATESWIVTPAIDLTAAKYAKMTFKESQMYSDPSQLTLWATVDEGIQPLGSVEGVWWGGPVDEAPKGTWEQLTIPNFSAMTGDTYAFVESGDVDLNGFAGEKVRIAFRYVGTTTTAGTWNWDDVVVYAGE